ncbi:MAG: glycosyltransferase [Fibrobacterota bacterium]
MRFLSVIIPCHNQRDNLSRLLDSLAKQSLDADLFEAVVADDGSTDDTRAFLETWHGSFTLKPVFLHGAGGPARARNAAFKQAQGKFVLFLDGDMTAHPDLLKHHALALLAEPGTANIGKVEPAEEERNNTLAWYRVSRGAFKLGPFATVPPKYFRTHNASVSRSLLEKTGGFNEAYCEPGGEDLEIGFRLAGQGASFRVLRNAVAFHCHPLTLSQHIEKTTRYARGNLRRLITDCPEHGERGYLFLFRSRHRGIRAAFNFFFAKSWFRLARFFAAILPFRNTAYHLYDYITYRVIYHNLQERHRYD